MKYIKKLNTIQEMYSRFRQQPEPQHRDDDADDNDDDAHVHDHHDEYFAVTRQDRRTDWPHFPNQCFGSVSF